MRAERVGADTLLAQIVHMVARRSAPAPRSSVSPTSSPPSSCRRWSRSPSSPRSSGGSSARAAARLRAGQRGGSADHRLPLRAGAGDADLDHRRDGTGRANGILFRNAEAMERLRDVDTLVVDKTGTLTLGGPRSRTLSPSGVSRKRSAGPHRQPRALSASTPSRRPS